MFKYDRLGALDSISPPRSIINHSWLSYIWWFLICFHFTLQCNSQVILNIKWFSCHCIFLKWFHSSRRLCKAIMALPLRSNNALVAPNRRYLNRVLLTLAGYRLFGDSWCRFQTGLETGVRGGFSRGTSTWLSSAVVCNPRCWQKYLNAWNWDERHIIGNEYYWLQLW